MLDSSPIPQASSTAPASPRAPRLAAAGFWLSLSKRQQAWLLGSGALLLAVIAERWLLSLHTFPWDRWAARIGMSRKPWPVWDITRIYQQVGRPLVAIAEAVVMLVYLRRIGGRRAIAGLVLALAASAVNGLIKIVCGPTPLWLVLPDHVGTNFPSGVVTFMTASVGYVGAVAWRQGRRLVPVVLAVAIVGAGPARVIGGQHLISDVLGAYALGAALLIVAYIYLVTSGNRGQGEARWNTDGLEAPA